MCLRAHTCSLEFDRIAHVQIASGANLCRCILTGSDEVQVLSGAQTLKVNLSDGSATGVTFTTKGPDGRRHQGTHPGVLTLECCALIYPS